MTSSLKQRLASAAKLVAYNSGYLRFLGPARASALAFTATLASILNTLNYAALIPLFYGMSGGAAPGGSSTPKLLQLLLPSSSSPLHAGITVLALFIAKTLANLAFSQLAGRFGESYLCAVRGRLLQAYADASFNRREFNPSQFLYLNQQIPKIGSLNWAFLSFSLRVLMALALMASILAISWQLFVGLLVFSAVLFVILVPTFQFTRSAARKYNESLAVVQQFICEEMIGLEIIRVWRLAADRGARLHQISSGLIAANTRLSISRSLVGNLQELLIIIAVLAGLALQSFLGVSFGLLLGVGLLLAKFLSAVNEASTFFNTALEVFEPSREVLDALPEGTASATPPTELTQAPIQFISWRISEPSSAFELTARRGERISIEGAIGKGKTTLIKKMLSLLKSNGTFRINEGPDHSLEEFCALYPRISYLPQQPVLFDGTVAENIHFNQKVLAARLDKLISDLEIRPESIFPDGLATHVLEGGRNLSGGQAQLTCVLRALLRPSEILVLDEPANHLGAELVSKIDSYLTRMDDRIVVSVSHIPLSFTNRRIRLSG